MRFRIDFRYDGTAYRGFQMQPGTHTVQSLGEQALATVLGEAVRLTPSGRTDSGVHALIQPCHLDVTTERALERIRKNDFLFKINSVLPDGIAVSRCTSAKGFHARNAAKRKTYEYVICNARIKNPFLEDKFWRLSPALDVIAMRHAARALIGKHDFSSFCAADSTAKDKAREIFAITFSHRSPAPLFSLKGERFIRIAFTGSGFLKQMIRNIVGTLVEIGLGKRAPEEMAKILAAKDRRKAGRTAPAQGLYLKNVRYR